MRGHLDGRGEMLVFLFFFPPFSLIVLRRFSNQCIRDKGIGQETRELKKGASFSDHRGNVFIWPIESPKLPQKHFFDKFRNWAS